MFPPSVRKKLKCYVYIYTDPRSGRPFYVGKGVGNRCYAHLKARGESEKSRTIRAIRKARLKPQIEILKYGLTEREALLVEATAIDLLDIRELTNEVRGHGAKHGARAKVEDVAAALAARPARIKHAVILINISRAFRENMSIHELYDATRASWKLGPKRERADYALSVYHGIVREVFEIASWFEAGSTMRARDVDGRPRHPRGRWEFVGTVATDDVRRRYIGRSVAHYFKRGAQNPVRYVNCRVARRTRNSAPDQVPSRGRRQPQVPRV